MGSPLQAMSEEMFNELDAYISKKNDRTMRNDTYNTVSSSIAKDKVTSNQQDSISQPSKPAITETDQGSKAGPYDHLPKPHSFRNLTQFEADNRDKQKIEGSSKIKKYSNAFSEEINSAASTYNVPTALIQAMIRQESNFNPNAVSRVGALGLMQLMPKTAEGLGVDPHDPAQNIMGGVRYISQHLKKYGSVEVALAAYNAGPGAVEDYRNGTNLTGRNPKKRITKDGIPPFPETLDYIEKVKGFYQQFKENE